MQLDDLNLHLHADKPKDSNEHLRFSNQATSFAQNIKT